RRQSRVRSASVGQAAHPSTASSTFRQNTLISYRRTRSVLRKRHRVELIHQALLYGDHQGSTSPKPATYFSRSLAYAHLVLFILPILIGITQPAYASGGSAPNGPGAASNWAPSNNTILGTAANTTSDVWFTGYN